MRGETKVGLGILGAAVGLGVAGDVLLRATPYGLNVLLWTVALLAALCALARWQRPLLVGIRTVMLVPLLASAALFLWRDSSWLAALNGAALLASAGLCAASVPGFRLRSAGLDALAHAWTGFGRSLATGPYAVAAQDVSWNELRLRSRVGPALALLTGTAVVLPLLGLFAGLFAAADPVFHELAARALPDPVDPTTHVVAFVAAGWVAAGTLRAFLRRPERGGRLAFELPAPRRATEVVVALALLDALFLLFAVVQLRTFFGGEEYVQATTGLTYAEYAREGFFQLVAATALAVPLVVGADWALRGSERRPRAYRPLALALVGLLLVVVAAALQRIRLYQAEYGLTEARVFATAFVLWLAVVLAWLAATVLASRPQRFAVGVLASAFAGVLALNALNPDALIARTNVERAAEGKEVDVRYLAHLSSDATPALVDALDELHPEDAGVLARTLLVRDVAGDWRTWNVSRADARAAVRERRGRLVVLGRS